MKMRTFIQNKLWRDKLPANMEAMGSIIHVKSLDDKEYDEQLRIKLLEEAQEVFSSLSRKDIIEELADVFEVIDALCIMHGFTRHDVIMAQVIKRDTRGGFMQRKFVTTAEHPEGSFGEQYCYAQPDKYPEITE